MNIKRSLGFAVLLYAISFIIFGGTASLFGHRSLTELPPLGVFVVIWLLSIPVVLLLAKWYFKKVMPTPKAGFRLGVLAVAVAFLLDGLVVLGTYASGESLDTFAAMYADWKVYATIVEIVLLTTYAGFEFDGTYTSSGNLNSSEVEK